MPLQVAHAGVQLPTAAEFATWRAEFDGRHCLRLPALLEPRLLRWIRDRLAGARFTEFVHPTTPPSLELLMNDAALHLTLNAFVNDTRLFDAVRHITRCGPIGCYSGRVYAMEPSPRHRDSWHDDVDGNRMVAMSVNIGDAYDGGVLCLRDRSGIVAEVANTGAGDAVLFQIRNGLEHVVTPVTGSTRKTAMAGWFQREPKGLESLRR